MEESRRGDGRKTDYFVNLKGKVLAACVPPAYMYGLETMALTEKQLEKVQICENNWIARIVGEKRADKRRMDELRLEFGIKESC